MCKIESDPTLVLHADLGSPKPPTIPAGHIYYYLQSKKEMSNKILAIFF